MKIDRTKLFALLTVLLAAGCFAGCSSVPRSAESQSATPNRALLDEVNRAGTWFHAKKTRPIWVKRIGQNQQVQTLEGRVSAHAGDFLCRGAAGELWPQTAKTIEARYTPTDILDAGGWRQYAPRPDTDGVMAAQVPHAFHVQAPWGRLAGKAGDYVLKNYRDRDATDPADVWIVDQALFHATYERVEP